MQTRYTLYADDWDEFYIKEALTCFNAGAYSSAVIMLGLLGEYLATRLVEELYLTNGFSLP